MIIYKEYDQEGLDLQYNNRIQVPEWAQHLERWERASRDAERKYSPVKDVAYSKGKLQNLDIYPSSQPGSKVLLFIHGGYWHKLDKSDFQFVGPAFQRYAITTVIINYPLAPEANMDEIVASCRLAIKWVINNIHKYNGNPETIYISGHSAGGHLAAMMMTEDMQSPDWLTTAENIKGVCAMSGLFYLVPIRLSEINKVLKMDSQMALRNSPRNLDAVVKCPLLVVVGEDESEEFKDQANEIWEFWTDGLQISHDVLSGVNHYSIIEHAVGDNTKMHLLIREWLGL